MRCCRLSRRQTGGWKSLLQIVILGYIVIMGIIQWKINVFVYWPNMTFLQNLKFSAADKTDDASSKFSFYINSFDVNDSIKSNLFYKFFAKEFQITDSLMKSWIKGKQSQCNDTFVGYGKNFALLRDVVIDPLKSVGNKGGENMSYVMNQKEQSEFLRITRGFFTMISKCKVIQKYNFLSKNHLDMWMHEVVVKDQFANTGLNAIPEFTLAVQRYEYANLYHTMTDWYNMFLMLMIFHQQPYNVTILLIDGHPAGGLDHVWTNIFHNVIRVRHLTEKTMFQRLIWALPGYFSPLMTHEKQKVPYLEEFKHFFLSSLSVNESHVLDCKQLSILLIWRHNYVAHPRNPKGKIFRKIKNEDELLKSLRQTYPNSNITGIQSDLFSVPRQLRYITNTDILIGMHGAGLTLSIFLPRHGGLIELFPSYSSQLSHFSSIAKWRRIHYLFWRNKDATNEFKDYNTRIPPVVLKTLVNEMIAKMCV